MSTDSVAVRHLGEDRFAIDIRGHSVIVDQPIDAGGSDTAPTPTELFVASLASCVAFYSRRFLARHAIPATGLAVSAEYTLGEHPARVAAMSIQITPPPGLPASRQQALLAVAKHCTVHNSLTHAPDINLTLQPVPGPVHSG